MLQGNKAKHISTNSGKGVIDFVGACERSSSEFSLFSEISIKDTNKMRTGKELLELWEEQECTPEALPLYIEHAGTVRNSQKTIFLSN